MDYEDALGRAEYQLERIEKSEARRTLNEDDADYNCKCYEHRRDIEYWEAIVSALKKAAEEENRG